MKTVEIAGMIAKREDNEILKDIYMNLSLCVSMASGYVWKDKVSSFYKLIAVELLSFFDSNILSVNYPVLYDEFIKENNGSFNTYFRKDCKFGEEALSKTEFLRQKLIYVDCYQLPNFLTSDAKRELAKVLSKDDIITMNELYNKQELNGDRYFMVDSSDKKQKFLNILEESAYYSITINDYLTMMSKGELFLNSAHREVFDTCILQIALYIAKKIKENTDISIT